MIIFQKDLLDINPAYNDSIVEYSTSLTGVTYSEIFINSNPLPFRIYPINNTFNFNYKDIVKVLINQNNFNDEIIPDLNDDTIYDDETLSLSLSSFIVVYTTTTADTITKDYVFLKNVEQLINYKEKAAINSNVRVLLPTSNYLDYHLPYFEGYPIDFAFYGLQNGDTFQFKNITTISESEIFSATTNEVKRFYLSDGSIANDNALGLSTTTNLVEFYVNDLLKANIRIKRFESKCGVYLKWFNDSGSYSYWLFEPYYDESKLFKTIDEINGNYDNLQNIKSTSNITGKNGTSSMKLKTSLKDEDKEYLSSILSSAKVEMYIHQTPFNLLEDGKFIGVKLNDGSFSFNNKNSNHRLEVTITLPDLFTHSL